MPRPSTVHGLQFFGSSDHVSGTFEDDGQHAGYRLEPCPFCGSTRVELANTHTPSYWVECRKCMAQAHGNMPSGAGGQIGTEREALRFHLRAMRSAVRAWNKRAIEPATRPTSVDITELLNAMDEAGFTQAERNNKRLRKAALILLLLTNNGDASCA